MIARLSALAPTEQCDHADYDAQVTAKVLESRYANSASEFVRLPPSTGAARLAAIWPIAIDPDIWNRPSYALAALGLSAWKALPSHSARTRPASPGGWRTGLKWDRFIARVEWYR
jgi:hypothetical protein